MSRPDSEDPPPTPHDSTADDFAAAADSPETVQQEAAGNRVGTVPQSSGDRRNIRESDVRSIFISDLHLGSRFSRCSELHEFLAGHWPENLFLVGDFVDGWALERHWHWPPVYMRLLARMVEMAVEGTHIFYTPGNHDDHLRTRLGPRRLWTIRDDFVHTCADGRRLVIIHGDQFDEVESNVRWLSKLGSGAYEAMLLGDRVTQRMAGWVGVTPKPMSHAVKRMVKSTVQRISGFENRLLAYAHEKSGDGIVCGHIHRPSNRMLGDVQYVNLGDWMEHATALVEYRDGRLELLDLRRPKEKAAEPPRPPRVILDDGELTDSLAELTDDLLRGLSGYTSARALVADCNNGFSPF